MDNLRARSAPQHRSSCVEHAVRLSSNPRCSLDLRPSDFFLFAHQKDRLDGIIFRSRDELLTGIREALEEIPVDNLKRVLEHRIERLERFLRAMIIIIHKLHIR